MIKLSQPGDDIDRPNCSYCGRSFAGDEDRINTIDGNGPISLCSDCYKGAGNSVR